jgi:glycerol kinase
MKRPLVLAFDIGTQSTRVMLIDQHGNILSKIQKQYEQPYYSQNPDGQNRIRQCTGIPCNRHAMSLKKYQKMTGKV